MKALRPVVGAAVLVAGFLYLTSGGGWSLLRHLMPGQGSGQFFSEPASAASSYSADEQNNIDIYKSAREATVNITSVVLREGWFFQPVPEKGTGSGFIINDSGEILTNNHVVNGSSQLTVTLADKKTYKATVLGIDERNDLALVKINPDRKLPVLKLGDSEHLVVGQKVLAIGNPFGLDGTLTTGIVSSLGRSLQTDEQTTLEGMIQTDAAINPGNSGGPLLDAHGDVIGINTAIYGQQGNIGIGFAMPISRAKAMLVEYQQTGKVTRPTLGVNTIYISGELAQALELPASGGLLIQRVERGSAAETAGLRGARQVGVVGRYQLGIGGDLIVAVEGRPVEDNATLPGVLAKKRGGDALDLTIYRNGRNQRVQVKLGSAVQRF
jgi:S1-C subfamily serine protease